MILKGSDRFRGILALSQTQYFFSPDYETESMTYVFTSDDRRLMLPTGTGHWVLAAGDGILRNSGTPSRLPLCPITVLCGGTY
jgi:hypothetical protein